MNFFEHQDKARGTTRKLVLLFALAVVSLVLITAFLIVTLLSLAEQSEAGASLDVAGSQVFLAVAVLVVAVVLFGTMFRMAQLRGGGRVVAESLGGRLLNVESSDADERKILNVVEEMAIAAGLPVPPVYLMEDTAINAFAAGYKQEDAVIGVTRGCIHILDRDELQGVIAHEFSHIFNGDMRLNIRLMGWLYGIMVIGMIGYFILRGNMYHSIGGGRGRNKGGIVFLGLGLIVVGYGGTFFGNLIKAAVSRQREFLADASAVQYTRNPQGIGGALKKIAGYSQGSMLSSVDASEISHMLFGQGIKAGFSGMFATHPPIAERIRRVDPRWDGKVSEIDPAAVRVETQAGASASGAAGEQKARAFQATALASGLVAAVGDPGEENLRQAGRQLQELPALIHAEAHNPLGACLLMHALIISGSAESAHQQQLSFLQQQLSSESIKLLHRLLPVVAGLPREALLTTLRVAMPGLKQLSAEQARSFLAHLQVLVQADKQVTLFEWSIFRQIQQHLELGDAGKGSEELHKCADSCASLLSVLARSGHDNEDATLKAFSDGVGELGLKQELTLKSSEQLDIAELETCVRQLQTLKPLQKPRLLKAMVVCIASDGQVLSDELAMLQAVGALLDCPVPPLSL